MYVNTHMGPDKSYSLLEALSSVKWSEPWLVALATSHAASLFLILLTRRFIAFQCILLLLFALVCACSPWINSWAAENYRYFATQQYFDEGGFFISLILSLPIVINCIIIVVGWFCHAFDLMRQVARVKFKRGVRDDKKTK